MKKVRFWMRSQSVILAMVIIAIVFILGGMVRFSHQVNRYINRDIHGQIAAMQQSSVRLVENELEYLLQITESVANLISQTEITSDEDIVQALEDYAHSSNLVRTLFVTLDGHGYTSYAGYIGQDKERVSLDGIPLSEIKETFISNPYYDEGLKESVFGVVSPTNIGGKDGVLVSSYNTRSFLNLLEDNQKGSPAEIGIVTREGSIIIGKSQEQFGWNIFELLPQAKFSKGSAEQMQTDFAKGISDYTAYSVEGVSRHCYYSPISFNDWYVVSTVKQTALLANIMELEEYGVELTFFLVIIMLLLMTIITVVIIKEQRKTQRILKKAATIDGLTGIYNRSTTEELVTQFLDGGGEAESTATLVIDIDDFKEINDTFGHVAGDEVLKKCAVLLKEIFSLEDVVGRIGGDEFVVFVTHFKEKGQVLEQAATFIERFQRESGIQGRKVSVSVGLSWGRGICSFNDIYKEADAALYKAKEAGKGQYAEHNSI